MWKVYVHVRPAVWTDGAVAMVKSMVFWRTVRMTVLLAALASVVGTGDVVTVIEEVIIKVVVFEMIDWHGLSPYGSIIS
jgi:hypothetical protein